jgi:hypothetical protein
MLGTIPQLSTANTSPLLKFEEQLIARSADIEAWFRSQWLKTPPPFYCSVDLRNAGFKLAPVDTNLFRAASTISTRISLRCACRPSSLLSSEAVRPAPACCWCRRTTRATSSTWKTSPRCSS